VHLIYCIGSSQPTFKYLQFQNPSFEAVVSDKYDDATWSRNPPQWWSCTFDGEADVQPNAFAVYLPPSDGKTYVGLVYRADNTNEEIRQKIDLKKYINYNFKVDLAYGSTSYNEKPISMKIWSSNSDCQKIELLWQSPIISDTTWKTFLVSFKPAQNVQEIMFEAWGNANIGGYILMDNLSSIEHLEGWEETVCFDDSTLINAYPIGATDTNWQVTWKKNNIIPSDLNAKHLWLKTSGDYSLEIKKDEISYNVNLSLKNQECEKELFIPNVITPNGDGKNDTFKIKGFSMGKWSLEIYNRWGNLVYQNPEYKDEWQGEYTVGIYYYSLKSNVSNRTFKGFIHVLN